MTVRRVLAAVAAVLIAAGVTVFVMTRSESSEDAAEPVRMVNLGDSFGAGSGTLPLQPESQFTCQRSSKNFASIVAARRGYRLTDVACAGAWTGNLYQSQYDGVGPQLDVLSPDTDVVTVMMGGNDAGLYSSLVGDCAQVAEDDPTGAPCRARLGDEPQTAIRNEIEPAVAKGLRDVAARAPRARIVIVGYPWLVPADHACRPAVRIADGDIAYVRTAENSLNTALAAAARSAGATFVDMAAASRGHDACAARNVRWIEPMVGGSSPIVMHPNEAGQRAMADAVDAALDRM